MSNTMNNTVSKDILQDIVHYTYKLGVVDLIRVNGTDTETNINAVSDNKKFIVIGKPKSPIPAFKGSFGMPNLNKLNVILGFDIYDDTSIITVNSTTKNNESVPTSIHFETNNSDFVNDYRLMSKEIVDEKMKNSKFKGTNWDTEFVPSVESISRLKKQAAANNEQSEFSFKTENRNLKVYFGDNSTHSGNFIFQSGVSGTIESRWGFPVKTFLSVMDLAGDKNLQLSNNGVACITVDSGLSVYTYYLIATVK